MAGRHEKDPFLASEGPSHGDGAPSPKRKLNSIQHGIEVCRKRLRTGVTGIDLVRQLPYPLVPSAYRLRPRLGRTSLHAALSSHSMLNFLYPHSGLPRRRLARAGRRTQMVERHSNGLQTRDSPLFLISTFRCRNQCRARASAFMSLLFASAFTQKPEGLRIDPRRLILSNFLHVLKV